jgi:chromosome partitioning protein
MPVLGQRQRAGHTPRRHHLEARGVRGFYLVIAANLKVAFVVNRKIANTAIGRDVASALAEFDVPVLPVALHQRVLYAESAAQGLAVFEVAPNSDAAREIVALVENINNQQRAAA